MARYQYWTIRVTSVVALTIVAMVPLLPLLFCGAYPATHEGLRYAVLTEHFRTAILNGVWYPRWLPNLAGGYGYPTFVFYQPLYFHFASVLALITGLPTPVTCWAVIGIASFLSACGVYLLGRMRGSRPFSVLAALLFLVTPYLYVDIYVRGDLSETLAMLLTPWPIYFALKIQSRVRGRLSATAPAVGFAASLAAIVMSHPATATFFFGCVLLFAVGLTLDLTGRENRAAFLKVLGIAILLGLTISSPFWETVFEMRRYAHFQALTAEYFTASVHVVYPKQLVSNYWDFGGSTFGDRDTMSFQLGVVHLVIALFGLIAARRDLKVWTAFVCYAILILMMFPGSRYWWDHLPLLKIIQFPWRLLSVIGIFQLYIILGLARADRPSRFPALIASMALLAFLTLNRAQFTVNPSTPTANRWGHIGKVLADVFADDARSNNTYAAVNEFLPMTAHLPPEPRSMPLMEVSEGTAQPMSDSTAFTLNYQLDAALPSSVLIRQFYFPGWRVDLDNQTLSRDTLERALTPLGLMTVDVASPGRHSLRAWYEGPPAWAVRNAIVALLSLSLTFALFWLARHRPLHNR